MSKKFTIGILLGLVLVGIGATITNRTQLLRAFLQSNLDGNGFEITNLAAQAANKVWAGPTSGGDASPAFRLLVASDIPSLSYGDVTAAQLSSATNNSNLDANGMATKAYVDETTNTASLVANGLVSSAQLIAATTTATLVSQGLVSSAQLSAATTTATLVSQGLVSAAQLIASTNTTTLVAQGLAAQATTFAGYTISDSSANLAAALTDETGSAGGGLAVFNQSPTIVTPTIASFANANHNHQDSAGGGTLDGAAIGSGTVSGSRLPARSIGVTIDGGGSAITSGIKGYLEVPWAGTIISATILGDQSGSIAIETWRTNSSSMPPTRAGVLFTNYLTTAQASTDATLTGATSLALSTQDRIGFNVITNALSVTRVTLQIRYQ